MRTVFLLRHSPSEGSRYRPGEFGHEGGPLLPDGIQEAKELKGTFRQIGIDVAEEPFAVSEQIRSYQTAHYAGAKNIIVNSVLNEVKVDLSPDELKQLLEREQLPEVAMLAARAILTNPPEQQVWVGHGLPIAGLIRATGASSEHFVPKMSSITQITIPK